MPNEWFEEEAKRLENSNDITYLTEGYIIEFCENIIKLMEENDIKQNELAEIMGVSPAYISKVLSGDHNMSIQTMVKFSAALKGKLVIKLENPKIKL